ncbi:hypothetical protein [Mangrovicoccus algicola]|uniref:Uncharacterized protein n=1 Tax=Mangrovicoccus algicola TaxID=2771008 RepID=A0A8J6YXK8_9RHOB|nr:hypothetical protein [Mangrovicoccus algicola]MBE3637703.1 hypothetical protein [Mangrovicoccus algicola]
MARKSLNATLTFILGLCLAALVGTVAYVYTGGDFGGESEAEIQIDLPGDNG